MASYKDIQAYVRKHYNFQPKTCWIAQVKEMSGLQVRRAWNRRSDQREEPCPPDKVDPIVQALRHFRMID